MELSQKILYQFRFCGLIYSMRKIFWDHRNGTLTKNSVSVPILWPDLFHEKKFLGDTEMELSQKILCQFRFCGLIHSMRKIFWDHRNGTLTKNSVSVPILWPNLFHEKNILGSQKWNSHKNSVSVLILWPDLFHEKKFLGDTEMELSQKILCQFRFCGLIYSMRKNF